MSLWTNLTGGLRAMLRQRETEADMDEELRAFLDASAERKMRAGMSPEQARTAARVEMGSMESVKENIRAAGWEAAVEAVWNDVRYSFRVLRKAPIFTSVVIVTLALGIGANTAIFSLIDSVLLRSLPVSHPEELVELTDNTLTNPIWEQIRGRQDMFSGVFAWSPNQFNLSRGGISRVADGLSVSGDFFRTLGLRAAVGRLLTVEDDRRGCALRAVLSYGFWQSRYGGAPGAVGSTISLNRLPFEVVGVAPAGFYGLNVGNKFDVAVPVCAADALEPLRPPLDQRSSWWLHAAGRPRPGIGASQLKARLAALSPAVFEAVVPPYWDVESQAKFRKRVLIPQTVSKGLSGLRKVYEEPLHILMAVVGMVLLIACANIAGLMLARAAARSQEMAMRQALGASRLRLVRQMVIESVVLSGLGALLGIAFARWGDAVLLHFLTTWRKEAFLDFSLDGRVVAFTTAVALLTGLAFGIAPALRATRVSLVREYGVRRRYRLMIVASQVALSLVLLVTAGLLLRSFRNLASTDVGFDREHVLLVNVALGNTSLPKTQFRAVYDQIESGLRAQPGVVSAAQSSRPPLSNLEWNTFVQSDVPNRPVGEDSLVYFTFISPAYFETLHSPLVAGRNFSSTDTAHSAEVGIINQTLARRFFPGVNPIGHTFRVEGSGRQLEPPVEVIGIVKDAKYETMREDTFPSIFRPVEQIPPNVASNFEVRTPLSQAVMSDVIQKVVAAANKNAAVEIHSLTDQVDATMTSERMLATLAAFFGALALLLATIGLYGTLSYLVTQRRVEFGIRMALGAQVRAILALVMRDVAVLLAVGIAAGTCLALAATRTIGSLLFGLRARDLPTLLMSALLLVAVSSAAGLLAARRAARVDPMTALRHD